MRGRKPEAGAQRRGGAADRKLAKRVADPAEIAVTMDGAALPVPESVASSERRMDMWRQVVGDGSAYTSQDVPLLSGFVTWMDAAEQIQYAMTNEGGGILLELDGKPSPFLRELDLATKNMLKLADQLGCTPLARARLGLTEAARNNLNMSIADRISRAVERSK